MTTMRLSRLVEAVARMLTLVYVSSFVPSQAQGGDGCLLLTHWHHVGQKSMVMEALHTEGLYQGYPRSTQPVQGLHLSLKGPHGLKVTWMSPISPSSSDFHPVCVYGSGSAKPLNASFVAKGSSYSYTAGMFCHTLNTAVLDLRVIPCHNTSSMCIRTLSYQCGDKTYGFSDIQHVQLYDQAVPLTPGPQFAVVGDMGVPHGLKTIASIASRVPDRVRMMLHAGDISYADHYSTEEHNNSYVWVDFMNDLETVAARLPYMTAPGNHEAQFEFAAYLNWLPVPHNASASSSPFWYSFDYLGVHVLAFSSEHDFSPNSTQYRWIQQDLTRANKNRAHVPWVVVMGHRPLYCSSLVCWGRCHDEASRFRGFLEDLLYEQRVDVVLAGHNHQYERSYPVYHGKATQKNYTNPQAPIYIVNGAAGNPELNDPSFEPFVDWRAWYKPTMSTGFLLMTPSISNLTFEYVMSDLNNVVDSFTIVRK